MSGDQPAPFPGFLGLVLLLSRILGAALFRIFTHPFRTQRASNFYKDVLYAAVRCMITNITIPQVRYLNPSTTQRYIIWCKSKNIEPQLIEIPAKHVNSEGKVHAHWIGNPKKAEVVVLYTHGGGYTQSATDGYYEYWTRWMQEYNIKCKSIAVLMVAYTLAPEAVYPGQLKEANAALEYLIQDLGWSPSNIIVSGDSAGGNLTLSLLSHLLHPHPEVKKVDLKEPLRAAFLISAWVSFRTDFPSYTRNRNKDLLVPSIRRWAAMFLAKPHPDDPETDPGPVAGDSYTDALKNEPSWWYGIHTIVSDVLSWVGDDEIFFDPIKDFESRFTEGWEEGGGKKERVRAINNPKHAHIAPIAGLLMDPKDFKCEGQVAIEHWLAAILER